MPGKIEGSVVSVSESGNLVTDITAEQLASAPKGESVSVRCDDHVTSGIFTTEHKEAEFTLLALIGSSGNLELEIVGDSAAIMLGISVGEKVLVEWP